MTTISPAGIRLRAFGVMECQSTCEALLKRVAEYEQGAAEQVAKLRVQLTRAEEFARTLRERVERSRGATV